MKIPLWLFMDLARAQVGDAYVFGAESQAQDRNPSRWDCSELIEWCIEHGAVTLGGRIDFPDGSMNQRAHCRAIPLDQAYRTKGALLFRDVSVTGVGHVAISDGNNDTTTEARGSDYGVMRAPIQGRSWTSAGLIPEVDYSETKEPPERVERWVVFGRHGGRFGQVRTPLGNKGEDRLLHLVKKAEKESGVAVVTKRREPKNLEKAEDYRVFVAGRRRR